MATRTTDDSERVHLLTGEELSEFADVHMNLGELSWVPLHGPSVFLGLGIISPCKQLLSSQVEVKPGLEKIMIFSNKSIKSDFFD